MPWFFFFGRWCQDVEEMHLNEQDKAVILAKVREMDLVQEYLFLRLTYTFRKCNHHVNILNVLLLLF